MLKPGGAKGKTHVEVFFAVGPVGRRHILMINITPTSFLMLVLIVYARFIQDLLLLKTK